jgi:hypothetical protein
LKKLVLKGFHDVHYHDAAFTRAVIHPKMTAVLNKLPQCSASSFENAREASCEWRCIPDASRLPVFSAS